MQHSISEDKEGKEREKKWMPITNRWQTCLNRGFFILVDEWIMNWKKKSECSWSMTTLAMMMVMMMIINVCFLSRFPLPFLSVGQTGACTKRHNLFQSVSLSLSYTSLFLHWYFFLISLKNCIENIPSSFLKTQRDTRRAFLFPV